MILFEIKCFQMFTMFLHAIQLVILDEFGLIWLNPFSVLVPLTLSWFLLPPEVFEPKDEPALGPVPVVTKARYAQQDVQGAGIFQCWDYGVLCMGLLDSV